MTDKITYIEILEGEGVATHVIIDRGNGEFTSMKKTHYDELQAQKENGTLS